jgi:hypothetical protein
MGVLIRQSHHMNEKGSEGEETTKQAFHQHTCSTASSGNPKSESVSCSAHALGSVYYSLENVARLDMTRGVELSRAT